MACPDKFETLLLVQLEAKLNKKNTLKWGFS